MCFCPSRTPLFFAAFVMLATPARAAGPARTPSGQSSEAGELTIRAKAAFDRGNFAEAAELLTQAYALKPSPALIYNLGRAYQQGGEKAKAVAAYERYLQSEAHPSDEGAVRSTVQELRAEIEHEHELLRRAEEAKARADEEARAKAPPPAIHRPSPVPWIVAGVGVAGIATGGVLGALASARHQSAADDASAGSAQSKQDQARTFATAANVAFVTGGVIAVAAIVWGIADVRASGPTYAFGPAGATIRFDL
jgi:tetratricopeptide (TPR) repeat protein